MTDKNLNVRIGLEVEGQDSATELDRSLGNIGRSAKAAGADGKLLDSAASELRATLERLAQQQGLIDAFVKQKSAVASAAKTLSDAQAKAQAMGRELSSVEEPTKRQAGAFDNARRAVRSAEEAYEGQRVKLQQVRGQLEETGISTTKLASAQVALRKEQAEAQQQTKATADWAGRMAEAQRKAAVDAGQLGVKSKQAAAGLRDQADAAGAAEPKLNAVTKAVRTLASVGIAGVLGSQTGQLLSDVASTADAFANLQAKVKLVTGEGAAFSAAWQGISEIALRTNSSLDTTATLFTKVAEAGKELGLSQQAALSLTETINQAVQLSGSSAEASAAAVQQLVQGLQSGVLRGDEFNSVMEQAPRLAKALAQALGVTTGELRNLAEDGKLTSETVIKALTSQKEVLEKEFAALPATVGRAIENLRTKWALLIGDLNSSSGATALVAQAIDGLASNLDEIAGMAARAGAVLVASLAVQGVGALRSLAGEMGGVGSALGVLTKNLNEVPKVVNITVAAVGLEIGYQIGQMLYENTELGRKLGVTVVAWAAGLVESLRLVQEAASAVFTSDTVSDAVDRWKQRIAEQRTIFQAMWEEAEKAPKAVADAAGKAATTAEGLGAKGKEAGALLAEGGAAGGAGMAKVGKAAQTALDAMEALVQASKAKLPDVGKVADEQAEALRRVVDQGGRAAKVFEQQLPQAIAKLGGAELASFRDRMVATLEETERAARRAAAELAAAGQSGAAELSKAERSASLLHKGLLDVGLQAAKSLGVDTVGATQQMGAEFLAAQEDLATLTKSLPALAKAGVDTGGLVREALANMLNGAANLAEMDAVIGRMDSLGIAGEEAGELLTKALDKRVESAETEAALKRVKGEFEKLGEQGRISSEQMADGLTKVKSKLDDLKPGINSLDEAARKAGLPVQVLVGGITKEGAEALKTIKGLVKEVIATGAEAERTSPALSKVFSQAIGAARTVEELNAMEAELRAAAGAGKIFGADLQEALTAVGKKSTELVPALRQAAADAKLLGVEYKSNAELAGNSVDAMLRAYERVKASGQASSDVLRQAFATVAKAAIDAAGGQIPEWVKVEAAIRDVDLATIQAGENSTKAAAKMQSGLAGVVSAAQAASQSIGAMGSAWAAANAARNATVKSTIKSDWYDENGRVKSDFSIDQKSGTIGSFQLKPPDNSGNWVLDAELYNRTGQTNWRYTGDPANLLQQGFGPRLNLVPNAPYAKPSAVAAPEAAVQPAAVAAPAPAALPTAVPIAAPAAAASAELVRLAASVDQLVALLRADAGGAVRHEVVLPTANGGTTQIRVSGEADVAALLEVLRLAASRA